MAHAYWRVYVAVVNSQWPNCAELEFRATVGGADQCSGGTAVASVALEGGEGAPKAFDDTAGTWWNSYPADAPQWIGYQFASPVEVVEISYQARGDGFGPGTAPKDFSIQYSDNGTDWYPEWSVAGSTGWSAGEIRVFTNPAVVPGTPTITVAAKTGTTVSLAGSAYVANEAGTHAASQWQVQAAGGDWSSPIYGPGDDATNKTALTVTGLEDATQYEARVRYKGNGGNYSAWPTAVSFNLGGFTARVSTVGRYIFRGPNARRVSTVGRYVFVAVESEPAAPGTPSVAAAADTPTQFTATITPGGGATDHELYVALSPTGLFDAGNLYVDSLGATPSPVEVTGRTPGLVYFVGVRAINVVGNTDSAIVSVEMPLVTDPELVVNGITDSGGTANLLNVLSAGADEARYETAAQADTTYSTLLDDSGVITEDEEEQSRFVYPITGQAAETALRTRASWRVTGGSWDSVEYLWSTLATLALQTEASDWLSPIFGSVNTGTVCPQLAVALGRTVASVWISDDTGATWTELDVELTVIDAESNGQAILRFCFDSTGYTDGWYRLRFVLDDAIAIDHYGFRIGNNLAASVCESASTGQWAKYWNPTQPLLLGRPRIGEGYSCQDTPLGCLPASDTIPTTDQILYHSGPNISGQNASFGPVSEAWLASNLGADVTGIFSLISLGGGLRWEWMQPVEFTICGIAICAQGDDPSKGIRAWIDTGVMAPIYAGDRGCDLDGKSNGFGWGSVGRGGAAAYVAVDDVYVGSAAADVRTGFYYFSRENGCSAECCTYWSSQPRSMPMRLQFYRPDPETLPRRWYYKFEFPSSPPSPSRYQGIQGADSSATWNAISGTVDLGYDLECGSIMFFTNRGSGNNPEGCVRGLWAYCAVPLDVETCAGEPPPPVEPGLPIPTVAATNDCGTVSVVLGGVDAEFTSIDVQVRRADTLAVVYTGAESETTWEWLHGVHTLPYDVALELRARYVSGGTLGEWSEYAALTVSYTFEDCDAIPCALLLEVYDDDRETVAWSVSTAPTHLAPYLTEPGNYGAQDIDVVAGAATIGQAEVMVVDRRQLAGDQDSGWLTERIPDVYGRRNRLRRFVDQATGWVTIADGPAATPRLDESYAAYRWVIKDTRETERKVRAFTDSTMAILPTGVVGGFGYDPDTATYLADPITPLTGTFLLTKWDPGTGDQNQLRQNTGYVDVSGLAITISAAAYEKLFGALDWPLAGRSFHNEETGEPIRSETDYRTTFANLILHWRPAGTTNPWTQISTLVIDGIQHVTQSGHPNPGVTGPIFQNLVEATPSGGNYTVTNVFVGDSRGSTYLPTNGQSIEFYVTYAGPVSEEMPYHLDGEWVDGVWHQFTAGALLTDLYDGVYSSRDTLTGEIVSTGIRYDPAALLQMTDLVRMRLTEPVDDLRAWAEEYVYAPTGWVPALDNDGRISPVSQEQPASWAGLTNITNAITEPSPDWNAGERIVNRILFAYPRLYKPTSPPDALDGIAVREVTHDYRDELSITRHSEQKVEYHGDVFAAIGDSDGLATGTELGTTLAAERQLHVLDRYVSGAQTIQVAVMRAYTYDLRAGDWVLIDLSWFPDYDTARRGLIAAGQIVAIEDLDCAWRRLLVEMVVPLQES